MPTNDEQNENASSALMRLVDPRLPLPWIFAIIVAAAMAYQQLQGLKEAVIDLQITVKAGNQSWAGLSGEQSLLKFRTTNNEEDIKALKAAVAAMQQGRRP